MEKPELLDLIPLYVTGKLSDEQRAAIERELPKSQELKDEIEFWSVARVVTRREAAYSLAGHLTSRRIVDYARGAISYPLEKSEIERHLQICELCSNDLETVKPAFGQSTLVPVSPLFEWLIHKLTKTVRSVGKLLALNPRGLSGLSLVFRPIYALPLAAILLVSGVIVYQLANPTKYPISFALQFQTQDRSTGVGEIQTLQLAQNISVVQLSVPIPHATLQPSAEDIILALSSPGEKSIRLNHGLSWSVGTPFDTAKVEVAASALQTSGIYSLHAAIKYASTSTPFEYSYRFKVTLGR